MYATPSRQELTSNRVNFPLYNLGAVFSATLCPHLQKNTKNKSNTIKTGVLCADDGNWRQLQMVLSVKGYLEKK